MADEKNEGLQTLRDEYKRCTESIIRDVGFIQQGMTFWTAGAVLVFSYGWDKPTVMLVVPFVYFYLIFHSLFRARMVTLNSILASVLEEKINESLPFDALLWESKISEKYGKSADFLPNAIAFVGSLCIIFAALWHYHDKNKPIHWNNIYWLEVIVSFMAVAFASLDLWKIKKMKPNSDTATQQSEKGNVKEEIKKLLLERQSGATANNAPVINDSTSNNL